MTQSEAPSDNCPSSTSTVREGRFLDFMMTDVAAWGMRILGILIGMYTLNYPPLAAIHLDLSEFLRPKAPAGTWIVTLPPERRHITDLRMQSVIVPQTGLSEDYTFYPPVQAVLSQKNPRSSAKPSLITMRRTETGGAAVLLQWPVNRLLCWGQLALACILLFLPLIIRIVAGKAAGSGDADDTPMLSRG